MCCGSKRSALSSASASRPPSRAVASPPRTDTTPAPVMAAPIPPAQKVDVRDVAMIASSDPSRQSPQHQNAAPPQAARRWRLSS
jgi:hypothetical protein